MDNVETWFATRDLWAQWTAASAAVIAAIGAIAAGLFARRAWLFQRKQVEQGQTQLDLAKIQHEKVMDSLEKERRALGPRFEVPVVFPFSAVRTARMARLEPSKDPILSGGVAGSDDGPEQLRIDEAVRDGQRVHIILRNTRPKNNIVGWHIKPHNFPGALEMDVDLSKVVEMIQPNRADEYDFWLLTVSSELGDCYEFEFSFETREGYVDKQIYRLTLNRGEDDRIWSAKVNRTSPSGYRNADRLTPNFKNFLE